MPDLTAHVCHQFIHSDAGGATLWMVRLPDGSLLDFSYGPNAQENAERVASLINNYGWHPTKPV